MLAFMDLDRLATVQPNTEAPCAPKKSISSFSQPSPFFSLVQSKGRTTHLLGGVVVWWLWTNISGRAVLAMFPRYGDLRNGYMNTGWDFITLH